MSFDEQVENILSGESSKTNLAYETLLYRFIYSLLATESDRMSSTYIYV